MHIYDLTSFIPPLYLPFCFIFAAHAWRSGTTVTKRLYYYIYSLLPLVYIPFFIFPFLFIDIISVISPSYLPQSLTYIFLNLFCIASHVGIPGVS